MATIRDITCIDWPTVSRAISMATDDGVGRATDTVYFTSEEGTESIARAIEEVYAEIVAGIQAEVPPPWHQ